MKSTARTWGFFPTCCGWSSPPAAIIAVLSLSCAAPSEQSDSATSSEQPASEQPASEAAVVFDSSNSATRGYTLLDEDLDETPGKTQVTMNILVPESATDQELTELLNQLLQDASQRTSFQYHEHPTVVGIYAYASREHAAAGMGQWEAMVSKTPLDPEPSVRIRPGRGTVEEPATSFGLTREERMAAYRQLVLAHDRAQAEGRTSEQADQLTEQYTQDLVDELGITHDQLDAIRYEAFQQNWPMPVP